MSKIFGLVVLVFVGLAGWRLLNTLSADAVALAVGVCFGILAGIPTALLMLASGNRRNTGLDRLDHRPLSVAEGRYTVLAGPSGPYLQDTYTGATYAIVEPTYKVVSHD